MAYYKRELQLKRTLKSLEKSDYKDFKATVINVGSPDIYDMRYIAKFFCDKIGIAYEDFVVEKELPDKMTLTKVPDLTIQNAIAPIDYEYNIVRGMNVVLYNVEKRLNNGLR